MLLFRMHRQFNIPQQQKKAIQYSHHCDGNSNRNFVPSRRTTPRTRRIRREPCGSGSRVTYPPIRHSLRETRKRNMHNLHLKRIGNIRNPQTVHIPVHRPEHFPPRDWLAAFSGQALVDRSDWWAVDRRDADCSWRSRRCVSGCRSAAVSGWSRANWPETVECPISSSEWCQFAGTPCRHCRHATMAMYFEMQLHENMRYDMRYDSFCYALSLLRSTLTLWLRYASWSTTRRTVLRWRLLHWRNRDRHLFGSCCWVNKNTHK